MISTRRHGPPRRCLPHARFPGTRRAFGDCVGNAGSRSMTVDRFFLIMVVFAAGTATAAYFVASNNVETAGAPAALQPVANTVPPQQPSAAPQLVPRESEPVPQRPVRIIPIERPQSETTGTSPAGAPAGQQLKAVPKQPQCDRRACSRAYRSFDEATCTYQPGRGGPRRLCEK